MFVKQLSTTYLTISKFTFANLWCLHGAYHICKAYEDIITNEILKQYNEKLRKFRKSSWEVNGEKSEEIQIERRIKYDEYLRGLRDVWEKLERNTSGIFETNKENIWDKTQEIFKINNTKNKYLRKCEGNPR